MPVKSVGRYALFCHCALAGAVAQAQTASPPPATVPELETLDVVARRLNEARMGIETQLGASVYTIDADAIAAMPIGDDSLFNQIALQAPDVAQDSFGQFHVRGEHNGIQYRINGIVLPEGISVFGQAMDPRLVSSLSLITGALPAEFGLRTAGIIDLTTKSGALDPGGSIGLYGGSHGTLEPSINYGGSVGRTQYYVSADYLANDLGIESPDGSVTPLHDRTKQTHVFAYVERVLNASDRISLIASNSDTGFQIPDLHGQQPGNGYTVNGVSNYDSGVLNETQREKTRFAIVAWQHSADRMDLQSAVTIRDSSLQFTPDPLGDLLYNGISQAAFKRNLAFDWQTDVSYRVTQDHTVRTGLYLQTDSSRSDATSQVLTPDNSGNLTVLTSIPDQSNKVERIASGYAQDEWRVNPYLTLNYGLRFDTFSAYTSATQLSPRINAVWKNTDGTTLHAGYSRYLSPPPFELIGSESVAKFANSSAAPLNNQDDSPKAERASYTDVGVLQQINQRLSLGWDNYYKLSAQLIDEGQFGAPIILTPFNYQSGRQFGSELTLNYAGAAFSGYANLSWQTAMGRGIDSAQFNFDPAALNYIAQNYIHLDHEQKVTASGGMNYHWADSRVSADFLLGSGLRADLVLPDGSAVPNGAHLPYYTQVNLGAQHVFRQDDHRRFSVKLDIVNLFDRVYEIRNGTGVGVGAPQYGPRRGLFLGISVPI